MGSVLKNLLTQLDLADCPIQCKAPRFCAAMSKQSRLAIRIYQVAERDQQNKERSDGTFAAVSVLPSSRAWAVGSPPILHWNGRVWHPVPLTWYGNPGHPAKWAMTCAYRRPITDRRADQGLCQGRIPRAAASRASQDH